MGAASASATSVPFTEDFDGGNAGWEDVNNDPLAAVGSGGVDGGGYVSTTFNYFGYTSPFGGGPVLFRATGNDAASGGAFIGDWLTEGVGYVSIWLRHDAPEELTPFLRVAGFANFPGAVLPSFGSVAANTWTEVIFEIDVNAPWCVGEGVTCADAFSNVANLQFGTNAPAGLVALDSTFTLDLDRVSLLPIPEPGSALLLGLGLVGIGVRTRSRG